MTTIPAPAAGCDRCPGGVLPELATADHQHVRACTADGVDHDYRPHVQVTTLAQGPPGPTVVNKRTYLRCVWCHGVTCGDADETDPCIEPYHHRVGHRTRLGVTWPIGGDRPDQTPKGVRR